MEVNAFCTFRHGIWYPYYTEGKITMFAAQWEYQNWFKLLFIGAKFITFIMSKWEFNFLIRLLLALKKPVCFLYKDYFQVIKNGYIFWIKKLGVRSNFLSRNEIAIDHSNGKIFETNLQHFIKMKELRYMNFWFFCIDSSKLENCHFLLKTGKKLNKINKFS